MNLRLRLCMVALVTSLLSACGFQGVYDVPLPGGVVKEEDSFEVRADFADALNVVPRTSVMVGDVPVGQVVSIERVGWVARVTMWVDDEVELPDNATAQIRQTSLLGEKFIELVDPAAVTAETARANATPAAQSVIPTGRLGDGDIIGLDRTGLNPEVEDVLGALSLLLTGGGVGQLQTITQEMNAVMGGRTDEMSSLLNRLDDFVGTVDAQRSDLIAAMESVNNLSSTLVAEEQTIVNALDSVGPAVDVLRDQHAELVALLTELDRLGVVGTRVINATKEDLIAELRHLEPILRELANTGDSLVTGAVAAASYPFPIDAADAIRGDYANVIFSMQIRLTPVSEGGLIPTTLGELETLCQGLPTAPLCSPTGDAINQLCGVLGTLPLCSEQQVGEISTLLSQLDSADLNAAAPPPDVPIVPEELGLDGLGLDGLLAGGTATDPAAATQPPWLTGLLGGLLQ